MSICRGWISAALCGAAAIRVRQTSAGTTWFCTLIDRSLPNVHPYGNLAIRADGKEVLNGWASSPRIEELRAAWLDTADFEQQKRICAELQKQLWTDVP